MAIGRPLKKQKAEDISTTLQTTLHQCQATTSAQMPQKLHVLTVPTQALDLRNFYTQHFHAGLWNDFK